jgi:UDP-N-acetylmuramyl pentapeptide phosphotransferase/UDP-N-acetylglucosamine-1-phosphate transferase
MNAARIVVSAAVASFLVAIPVRAQLVRLGIIDRPNVRSSHTVPTARGGGIGFVAVIVLGVGLVGLRKHDPWTAAMLLAAALLAVVSFIDDRTSLGVRPRLAVHAVASLVPAALFALPAHNGAFGAFGMAATAGLAATTFLGTIGYTNAFNFMDGIDGIAASHAVVVSVATVVLLGLGQFVTLPSAVAASRVVAPSSLIVAGAVLGFLPWNFPRAKMFMGDVGSAFLGYVLACLYARSVHEAGLELLLPLAMVHMGFVLDTAITLVRRALRRERLSEAHREHFYQRLVRSGLTHPTVTGIYTALSVACAGLAVFAVGTSMSARTAAFSGACVAWLVLFAFAERRFRKATCYNAGVEGPG